jgi:hypothetical protein
MNVINNYLNNKIIISLIQHFNISILFRVKWFPEFYLILKYVNRAKCRVDITFLNWPF